MDQLDHITVTVISLPVSLLVSHQLDGMCASGETVAVVVVWVVGVKTGRVAQRANRRATGGQAPVDAEGLV